MPITSFPFDNGMDTTEVQYGELFSELQDSGVASGFDESSLAVTPGAALSVNVAPGQAVVRGHFLDSDTVVNLPVAAPGGAARRDLVVARLDLVAKAVSLVVVVGSSATVDPPLTQTQTGIYELPLARVTVPAGATVLDTTAVADLRRYVGGRVGVWTTATRPAAPRRATFGFNVTVGGFEFWSGTAWTSLVAQVGNAATVGGLEIIRSATTPPGVPSTNRVWIRPLS